MKKILTIIISILLIFSFSITNAGNLEEAKQKLLQFDGTAAHDGYKGDPGSKIVEIFDMLINYNVAIKNFNKLKNAKEAFKKAYQNITSTIDPKEKKKKVIFEYLYYKIAYVLAHPDEVNNGVNGNIPTPTTNNGKIPFESSFVKVDALGNVQIRENGKRKYFFPICIYHDNGRKNRADYAKGGRFNCIIARNASFVARSKKAGLKSVLQVDQYKSGGELSGQLGIELEKIRKMGLGSSLIALYTDNEGWNTNDSAFPRHRQKKVIADKYDRDPKTGKRAHPLYYLNGDTGDAKRQDANGRVSDITGSYVYERYEGEAENGPAKIIALENNGTKQPVVFAQLNFGVGAEGGGDNKFREPIRRKMTPIAMSAVAVGAKGLGYWRDKGSTGEWIEKHGFRDDLPKFRRDIEKLMAMGLIQQSHRSFGVRCGQSDSAQIGAGTRKLNGIGYLILSNWNNGNKTINCRIENLGYIPKSMTDVLKGGNVGRVNGNSISVNVPAYGRVVVKLNK